MKVIKWLVISILAIGICAVLYLTVFFNVNDFKPQIVDAVKQHTGRTLTIVQDLSWSFFPTLGINVGSIAFSNPDNFQPQQMLQVKQAVANVALLPLFSQQVKIDNLTLDGLTLNLITDKKGNSSFDDLSPGSTDKPHAVETSNNNLRIPLASFEIGGVAITNMQINMIDMQANSEQHFTLKSFTLGEFSLGKFADMAYEFEADLPDMKLSSSGSGKINVSSNIDKIQISDFSIQNVFTGNDLPNKTVKAAILADFSLALDTKNIDLIISQLSIDSIQASAKLTVNYGKKVPIIDLTAEFGEIDLNALLPKSTENSESNSEPSQQNAAVESEPDLSGLKELDLSVKLKAKSIKVNNLTTQNWQLNTHVKQGIIDIKQLSAELYQGKLNVQATIDGRNKVASYQYNQQLENVQIRPLLSDLAELDLLSGTANFSVKGKGRSLIPAKLKQQLVANGQFEIADGSLYGVNIPQMIRSGQKKLAGDLSAEGKQELKTDFTSLTGGFSLLEGVLTNPDLAMASPLIRLDGKGTANIITQQIDYNLVTKVVGSLAGQGAETDPLSGIDIPLKINGSFDEPKFALDTQALMKGKLNKETDKLKDSLFKKLGGL
ncbi:MULTISPECIES: AsmA family protein [Pseudomonadati]|uniref:AsmA family protein n=1 Tax=Shewanella aestuarii TaxID=1028752 RepID=A0ABT0KX75_9GAMM|nr:AsmA family protein [Shewanella aestuarii]MCL1116066.1 AsmA family protein [Shewanella aestuarii]GGN70259.1 cell envelope biogenesis protein AsmA [Shewanella aestuarii]